MTTAAPSIAIPRRSSSRDRPTSRRGGSPISPVMRTITSVPPAIGVIWSSAVEPERMAQASAREAGVSIGGSTGTSVALVVLGGVAPPAAEREPHDPGDDRQPDRDVAGREGDGVLGAGQRRA